MSIKVLRLGHRFARDKRLSTHVGLTGRAFGADELILDSRDERIKDSIDRITSDWGGDFKVSFISDWKGLVNDFPGETIHLTMYGLGVDDTLEKLSDKKDRLVIVGGAKVPGDLYKMVNYNVSIGSQPHSEVAALAVFLDRLLVHKGIDKDFAGRKRVIPMEKGKNLVNLPPCHP